MYDLVVCGGGPAGSAAAITTASAGFRVLLLERGRFPRQKVCGEFVSAESLDLLRTLLHPDQRPMLDDAIRIPRARIFVDGRVLQAPVDPPAASIARLDMDLGLWQSALAAGVEGLQQVTVNAIEGQGPFRVSAAQGSWETRAVIDASGRWSNLRQRKVPAAPGPSRRRWMGIKAHFADPAAPASVDLYFFPGGYCGVQPVALSRQSGRRVNACAMVEAGVASSLPEVLVAHPELKERSQGWTMLGDPVTTAPLLFGKPQPVHNAVLLAGDAVCFVDPFVGDGISLALRSGAMAARALAPFLGGRVSLRQAVEQYARDYRCSLGPVFRASSRLRRMLALPGAVRAPLVSLLEGFPSVARWMVRTTR